MSHHILIVDDTPEIAELLAYALRDRGYDVAASGFSTDITELVASRGAEALVLDCSQFDMSESLFDTLREDSRHATLPVVIITDTPDQAVTSLRSRKAQNVLLVPKPFTGGQVATALDQLFEQGRAAGVGD